MTSWTNEKRYLPYAQWPDDRREQLKAKQAYSHWHLAYHIQPAGGLLNDPNGFSYFNGQWHLCYQYFPYGALHGLKSWAHVTSTDLVNWKDQGICLYPDTRFDSHGAYSGSALPVDDRLFLMYTGNVRTPSWGRETYQLGAWVDQEGQLTKLPEPILTLPDGYTSHFRDPQIFWRDGCYWMIIGAQTIAKKGVILLYQSEQLTSGWEFKGHVDIGYPDLGYMVECPQLLFIDEHPVMIFCPQGLPQSVCAYDNIYPQMVVFADAFDLASCAFVNPSAMKRFDEGFDCYATQAIQARGRSLAVSWLGLPDISVPSATEDWAHALSIVKELSLERNRLIQRPVEEMKTLRQACREHNLALTASPIALDVSGNNRDELIISCTPNTQVKLELFAPSIGEAGAMTLCVDGDAQTVSLYRGGTGIAFGEEYGVVRQYASDSPIKCLRCYLDRSTLEIFINDGEATMSSLVYPVAGATQVWASGEGTLDVRQYTLQVSSAQ